MSNCVGYYNYRYFFLFLFHLFVATIYTQGVTVHSVYVNKYSR